jgi:membrane associated rhomboid family serine protease
VSEERPGPLDRAVELLAELMTAVGLNGSRMLWRWKRGQREAGEARVRRQVLWRSAKAQHKMCRSCRALVPRGASSCPDCGASMASVSTPGIGRMVTNLMPGITAATSLLMLVNGFWFVMMILAQIKAGGAGLSGFDMELLVRFGAGLSRPQLFPSGEITGGEWWRLVTPIFLHAGLLHFFFNSFLLIQLGPIVEEIYGTQRFWVIYLCCGIGGSMASQWTRPVVTVGASGAIMGLIGLLLVYGYRSRSSLGQNMKQLIVRLLVYTVILSIFFNIDHRNHIGGFLTGALAALVVPTGQQRDRSAAVVWQIAAIIGVLVVLLAFSNVALQGRLGAAT